MNLSKTGLQPRLAFPNRKSELHLYGAHAFEVNRGWKCNRHLHHGMVEINLVLDGCQTAVVGGGTIEQRAGDLLVIPPMRPHEFKLVHTRTLHYFVFHLQIADQALLNSLASATVCHLPDGHAANAVLRPLALHLFDQLSENASTSALFRTLYGMLDELERLAPSLGGDAGASSLPGNLSRLIAGEIERLVLYADPEHNAPLGNWLDAIARKLGVSRRHCARVFQTGYGMAPRQYLSVLRQQEAMRALLAGSDSVEQIARRIRFENAQSFIRQFTKWTGSTPGAYRKTHKDELLYLIPLERR